MPSSRTALRLRDIIEDADRIAVFIEGMSSDEFRANERTMFAVERLPQRITEAAIQVEPAEAAKMGANLPVAQMRAFGNRLRYEYRDMILALSSTLLGSTCRCCGQPQNWRSNPDARLGLP